VAVGLFELGADLLAHLDFPEHFIVLGFRATPILERLRAPWGSTSDSHLTCLFTNAFICEAPITLPHLQLARWRSLNMASARPGNVTVPVSMSTRIDQPPLSGPGGMLV